MSTTQMAGSQVIAIQAIHELDGRISWFPRGIRGYAPTNCYLVNGDGASLLIDTGLAADRATVLGELERTLPSGHPLSVLLLRMSEFDSTSNLVEIEEMKPLERIYSTFDDAPMWGAYSTEDEVLNAHHRARLHRIEVNMIRGVENVTVGGRRLKLIRPLLRLLPTYWVYDETTRVLYTSDSFGHVFADEESAALAIRDGDKDPTTVDDVRRHLLETRYWWLAHAATSLLQEDVQRIFSEHDVEAIAPARGAVLLGSEVVERHVGLLTEVLGQLGDATAESLATERRAAV
ncbi:hypothetical protein JL108_09040 [Aeromicrobium sp. YIM 150415]|uniref:hypothetical protein n=1 Tax=Aeromicrobium sp. YIM 150415 TaxID=2803912 RepID=UPI001966ADA3|nr:hypothetical protein [Aeromicrobium sp. YIM 150415]MBM9463596.1 hypothetical protein [Aeromicrobium sp. YIM 150415]